MKILRYFNTIFDRFNIVLIIAAGVLLTLLLVIIGTDVILRYFFLKPLGWSKEISEYILLYMTFLIATWILQQEGHVKMDIVLGRLSQGIQKVINIITSAISACVCMILTYFSITVTIDLFETDYYTPTVLEWPKGIFIAIIAFGYFMLFIQLIRRTANYIADCKTIRAG